MSVAIPTVTVMSSSQPVDGFAARRGRVTVLEEPDEVRLGAVGRWYIYTRNTLHIITLGPAFGRDLGGDLDERSTYLRVPGPASRPFRDDGHVSALIRIDDWPTVGARFAFRHQRVDVPHRFEERHVTSAVRRIECVSLM